ncbi:MAG: dihydropteroate synthase [Candidatus Aminicenantes bacterium]|nr:dihydropteroate synthase [Candidatus Aminicenantes bacterium]
MGKEKSLGRKLPLKKTYHLDIRGKTIKIGPNPWLMGIVNVTPDSFSDGGMFLEPERAVDQALRLVEEGARIIDIGGESTRPGSTGVSEEEEIKRVLPVIKKLRPQTKALISVDTRKSRVARLALEEGADLINDISALGHDPEMAAVVAEYKVPVILMHMLGTPETMQLSPAYNNLLFEIKHFLLERIRVARKAGIKETRIIIDPGIGFGKTLEHNLELIKHLDYFLDLDKPILLGPSRKSFIGLILQEPPAGRLSGTIVSCLIGYLKGASILRVHDVQEIKRAFLVLEYLTNLKEVAK